MSGRGWSDAIIVAEPVGANEEGENKGGLAFFLKNGPYNSTEHELARVAFDREEGARDTSFNETVDHVVDLARKSVETIKELWAEAGGELQ